MSKLTNSIEHRKCKRVRSKPDVYRNLEAKKLALKIAFNSLSYGPHICKDADRMYQRALKEVNGQ